MLLQEGTILQVVNVAVPGVGTLALTHLLDLSCSYMLESSVRPGQM